MPNAVLIGMAVCQMMDVWLGGERDCPSVSVSESMAAICQFHRLFSAPCALTISVAFCYVCAYELLLYVHSRSPVNSENIANTDVPAKHSRVVKIYYWHLLGCNSFKETSLYIQIQCPCFWTAK